MLKDLAKKYYIDQNFNCAETMMRAANEYYNLVISANDMRMMAGFGGGMQTGNTCGSFAASIAILSMMYVETTAHESKDIRPICMTMTRKFQAKWETTLCREIKAKSFTPEIRCLHTIEVACDLLEETIAEYEDQKQLF